MSDLYPETREHAGRISELVRTKAKLRPVGSGSKPALSGWGNLTLHELSGVLAYDPQEYTFTALAGTAIKELTALLEKEGQYLPFDPPFIAEGATLGGTVAAGLSGAGRFRYGGVRDFLLGVRFVDGSGRLVTGGGKVVKNAAGFDFPKLLVGSLGQFGVMVELTFKVFPRPEKYLTLEVDLPSLGDAVKAMTRLARSGLELSCIDLLPTGKLVLRLGGAAAASRTRLERLEAFMGQAGEVSRGETDSFIWRDAANFSWLPEDYRLVKIPLTPGKLLALDAALNRLNMALPRRYSVAGNLLWLAWPKPLALKQLDKLLTEQQLGGLVLTGSPAKPLLGQQQGSFFHERIRTVLDPESKFVLEAGRGKQALDDDE